METYKIQFVELNETNNDDLITRRQNLTFNNIPSDAVDMLWRDKCLKMTDVKFDGLDRFTALEIRRVLNEYGKNHKLYFSIVKD